MGAVYLEEFSHQHPEPLLVPSAQNTNQTRVLKISANYTITPRIINEFGFGFTLYTTGVSNSFDGKAFTQGLGLTGLQNLFYNGLPQVSFNNISALDADRLSSTKSNTYGYTDAVSWSKGQHQLQFGEDIRTLDAITPLGFNGSDNYGTFQYNTQNSTGLFTGSTLPTSLWMPYQTFYDVVQEDNDGQSTHYDFFGQDQWKASPRLSLTYGFRYELIPAITMPMAISVICFPISGSGESIYPNGRKLLATAFLASANACTPSDRRQAAHINGVPSCPCAPTAKPAIPGLEEVSRTCVYAPVRICLSAIRQ